MPEPNESAPHTPPTLESVLGELDNNPDLPDIFKAQARNAAGFIERLDTGRNLDDPNLQRWLTQLSRHFLKPGPAHHDIELPPWTISQRPINWDGINTTVSELKTEYPKWVVNQGGQVVNKGEGQDYFALTPPDSIAIGPRRFKMYIEGSALLSGMKDGKLTELFDRLKRADISPASMKLYGNKALPIYFYQDVDRAPEAVSVFEDVGIRFRGPAQDIWIVEIRGERPPGLVDLYSNDQVLDTSYKLQRYSAGNLLDNYLKNICIPSGKSPDNPYMTSFVRLIDRGEDPLDDKIKNRLLTEGPQHAGYPLVYKQIPPLFRR